MTTVLAATLPGDGTHNQDAYAYGDGWAVVADGATSFAGDRSHDPGWYAQQLVQALAQAMPGTKHPSEHLADAICVVRDAYHLTPDTAPTATVAIARWVPRAVEACVLGDCLVAVLHADHTEAIHTDHRLSAVAVAQRTALRAHLARYGFTGTGNLLLDLQAEQARHRNQPGGYWVAGADPTAAQHAMCWTGDQEGIKGLVLATDGVAIDRHPTATDWRDVYDEGVIEDPAMTIQRIHDAEGTDPDAHRWPRAKIHDDKTLIVVGIDGT